MALPQTDLEWVTYLSLRHDAERKELEDYDRYYEGTQAATYMHPEILREVSDRIAPVVIAWPRLVVDSVEERLDVEGFRLPDSEAADDDLWRVWQSNDMDEQSQLGHVDALTMRRSYVTVGTNADDRDTPLLSMESPMEVFADIDPRDRRVRAALRRVEQVDPLVQGSFERSATLYLPDRTVFYEWRQNAWGEVGRDVHNLGAVPVVPLINRGRLTTRKARDRGGLNHIRYGRSELDPVIPLADAANKIATDMMLAAEFVALPLRGFWGLGPEDIQDEQGNKLTKLQAIMGRMLTLAETEGKEFQFPAADLANFHNSINSLARLVAAIAGLPPHYLGYASENPASADAIRSAESRLVKRAERKQRAFGGSYEQVMRLVRQFQNDGDEDPRLRRLETMWRDASTPTVAQRADATVKLYGTPPHRDPIVTLRQAREDLGYTDAQIARMEGEDAERRSADPVAEIARQMSGNGAEPEPAGVAD
ncbi:MAG: phage portal protein [Jiangellaceae bacterium]